MGETGEEQEKIRNRGRERERSKTLGSNETVISSTHVRVFMMRDKSVERNIRTGGRVGDVFVCMCVYVIQSHDPNALIRGRVHT